MECIRKFSLLHNAAYAHSCFKASQEFEAATGERDVARWRAIFITAEGSDYCREDAPESVGRIEYLPPADKWGKCYTLEESDAWKKRVDAAADEAEKFFRAMFARTADHTARENVVAFKLERW